MELNCIIIYGLLLISASFSYTTHLATKDFVNHNELQPYMYTGNFTIDSNQEMESLTSEKNYFELYLLEEADFVCVTLALFFLRGQALDWSLAPLSLKAKARIKNMPSI